MLEKCKKDLLTSLVGTDTIFIMNGISCQFFIFKSGRIYDKFFYERSGRIYAIQDKRHLLTAD